MYNQQEQYQEAMYWCNRDNPGGCYKEPAPSFLDPLAIPLLIAIVIAYVIYVIKQHRQGF